MKFLNWKVVTLFWVINIYYIVGYIGEKYPIAWKTGFAYRWEHQPKFTPEIFIYLICAIIITLIINDLHLYYKRWVDFIIIRCLLITITLLAIFLP